MIRKELVMGFSRSLNGIISQLFSRPYIARPNTRQSIVLLGLSLLVFVNPVVARPSDSASHKLRQTHKPIHSHPNLRPLGLPNLSHNISTSKKKVSIAWLPSASVTQHEVFEYIASTVNEIEGEKANALRQPYEAKPIASIVYPQTNAVSWAMQRYRTSPKDSVSYYILVYQDLTRAHQLLSTKNIESRREGMRLAINTQLCVLNLLGDKKLYARIYEGFLLPYIGSAYTDKWQDLSRQQIVEGTYNAYKILGSTQRQISLLNFYLDIVSSSPVDQSDADWAHGQLAQVLASQGRYAEAIKSLQSIQSSNSALKQMVPVYQEQLNKQKLNR